MGIRASVYIAASVDGFIARKDGSLDWLEHDSGGEDYGYGDFMAAVDTIIMGRNTYEKVLTFEGWPYESYSVVVLSHTLNVHDVPRHLAGKVEITSATPAALVETLAAAGVQHLYVDGGKIIQSFLREGLINELIISRIPVLLGEGIPLFGTLACDIKLTHVETKTFASGLVQTRYRVR
jgi:dihydrofolate reductase